VREARSERERERVVSSHAFSIFSEFTKQKVSSFTRIKPKETIFEFDFFFLPSLSLLRKTNTDTEEVAWFFSL
jgi:hypothetical protein